MQWRIWKEKLALGAALRVLDDDVLAKEIFTDQRELGLPGLVEETQEICKTIGVKDISQEDISKDEIQDALEIHHLRTIKEEMGDKKKYQNIKIEDVKKPQDFLQDLNMEECCVAMRIKCFMIDCSGNMRSKYKGREVCLKCCLKPGVQGPDMRETQNHLELCESYTFLREGRDMYLFKDKVNYFKDLIKEREEMFTRIRKAKKNK